MTTSTLPEAQRGHEGLEHWVFKDRESLEAKFGMELDRIKTLGESDQGREELLKRMQEADPALNGNAHKALDLVHSNMEQLEKKEGFFKRMLKLPVHAVKAVGRTMKRHPILTAVAGITALLALLYFIPAPPGVGALRDSMIEGGKEILKKIGIGLPEASTEAISEVPVTGGAVPPEIIENADRILENP